jgi:hypothetical protein
MDYLKSVDAAADPVADALAGDSLVRTALVNTAFVKTAFVKTAIVSTAFVSTGTWRKSACSGTNGNCVEVARATNGVAVRDTADRAGVVLRVPAAEWSRFTRSLR